MVLLIGSRKIWEPGAALTAGLQSFETKVLTQERNLPDLGALNRELVARAEAVASVATSLDARRQRKQQAPVYLSGQIRLVQKLPYRCE
jgi:hypothetical protein